MNSIIANNLKKRSRRGPGSTPSSSMHSCTGSPARMDRLCRERRDRRVSRLSLCHIQTVRLFDVVVSLACRVYSLEVGYYYRVRLGTSEGRVVTILWQA